MMKEILNPKNNIDSILVWKLSRLSRKLLDTLTIFDELSRYNKKIISISEQIDSMSPAGKILVTMHSWVAEMERDGIVDNVKHGMKKKAEKGLWNGKAPYGYKMIDKHLVIIPEEAEIIKTVFDLYVNKAMGYKAIALYLNQRNILTSTNNKWDVSTIRDKLRNPIYAGLISWNKLQNYSTQRRRNKNENPILVKGQHEPIIDQETWEKAKTKQKNSPGKFSRMYPGEFLVSGILRCPDCEGPMVGYRRNNLKNGNLYRYYQCNEARAKGTSACKHNMVSADLIEQTILSRLSLSVENKTYLKEIYKKINNNSSNKTKEHIKELKFIETSISQIEKKLNRLLDMRMNDELTSEEYKKNKDELIKEKLKFEENKTSIINQVQSINTTISYDRIIEILKNFNTYFPKVTVDKQKYLLKILIEQITLNKGNNPQERTIKNIKLRFSEPQSTSEAQKITNFFPTIYGTVHPYLS